MAILKQILFVGIILLIRSKPIEELNQEKIYKSLKENKYLLVVFGFESCPVCDTFEPELKKLEEGNQEVQFAKFQIALEEGIEKSFIERFELYDYPSLILFVDGIPIKYTQSILKSENIGQWINYVTNHLPKCLDTKDQYQEFIRKNSFSTIYFGVEYPKLDKNFHIFYQLATSNENQSEIRYAYLQNPSLLDELAYPFGTIVSRILIVTSNGKFTTKAFNFELNQKNLRIFNEQLKQPKLINYSQEGERISEDLGLPLFVLFVTDNQQSQRAREEYETLAEINDEPILYSISEQQDFKFWTIVDQVFFKHIDKKLPQLWIFGKNDRGKSYRYHLNSKINEGTILEFYSQFKEGKLTSINVSSEKALINQGVVYELQSSEYEQIILKSEQDVVMFYYNSNSCLQSCKEVQKLFEDLAWELRSYSGELLFAKLDTNYNEVPLVILTEPMIWVPIHYDGKPNRSELIHFIRLKTSLGSQI